MEDLTEDIGGFIVLATELTALKDEVNELRKEVNILRKERNAIFKYMDGKKFITLENLKDYSEILKEKLDKRYERKSQ